MKIVIVETTLDSETIGGGNLYLPALIKGLVQKGHEVHVVIKGKPNPKIEAPLNESGAAIHLRPWKKKGILPDIVPVFAKWINSLSPDVYFVSASYDIGWVVLPYLSPSIASFAVAHSNTNNYYLPVKHYQKFITNAIGVSHEICNNYKKVSELADNKITWIPYGIKVAPQFPESEVADSIRLIFAGRLTDFQKRISDVKLIIKKLTSLEVPYHFNIVGDGEMYQSLKDDLASEIENGGVSMHGWQPGELVLEMFKRSDVFILTSDSEGFSVSLTEAMGNGCCPVVTDIPSGSVQLIKNDENGFLIKVGDIDAFATVISKLQKDKESLNELRKSAWETGKQFSTERMVEAYLDCMKKGITDNKQLPRQQEGKFPLMPSAVSKYPKWIRRLKSVFSKDAF